MHLLKRLVEIITGVLIAVFLLCRYAEKGISKPLVNYVMPYQPFKAILIIILIIPASRLIACKPKDYSSFFYKMLSTFLATLLRKLTGKIIYCLN